MAVFAPLAPVDSIAGTCTVPGTHPTIQSAIDDPACTGVEIAAQTYLEFLHVDRSLQLSGPPGGGAIVRGQVTASGVATEATFLDFRIESGCAAGSLAVSAGAQVTGSGLEVVSVSTLPCNPDVILQQGFEG